MPDQNILREILEALDRNERATSALEDSITRLVRGIEQEDHLRERAERAEQRERDDRHDELRDLLRDDLLHRVEGIGKSLRELPDHLLQHIERKIYELRTARWEAIQAGVQNEPGLLPPPPTYREQTGKIAVARRDVDDRDRTGVFDLAHTDGEKRAVKEFVGGIALHIWHKGGKWATAIGGGGGIIHLLHKIGWL